MSKKDKTNIKKENETILEVNEVTEETVRAEEEQKAREEKAAKERASNLRKERIKKTFEKFTSRYNVDFIVKLIMWAFFAVSALYVNASFFKLNLRGPALRVFVAEKSLQEESKYEIKNVDNIKINLDSFDVDIRETNEEDIIIRYSKKYDKKIKMQENDGVLSIEEKNKVFKMVRFETSNNLMIIEIPNKYHGSLEIESKNGLVKLEKYKIGPNIETETEVKDEDDFYKKFFNI